MIHDLLAISWNNHVCRRVRECGDEANVGYRDNCDALLDLHISTRCDIVRGEGNGARHLCEALTQNRNERSQQENIGQNDEGQHQLEEGLVS